MEKPLFLTGAFSFCLGQALILALDCNERYAYSINQTFTWRS
jgi:hypothetical protein